MGHYNVQALSCNVPPCNNDMIAGAQTVLPPPQRHLHSMPAVCMLLGHAYAWGFRQEPAVETQCLGALRQQQVTGFHSHQMSTLSRLCSPSLLRLP